MENERKEQNRTEQREWQTFEEKINKQEKNTDIQHYNHTPTYSQFICINIIYETTKKKRKNELNA